MVENIEKKKGNKNGRTIQKIKECIESKGGKARGSDIQSYCSSLKNYSPNKVRGVLLFTPDHFKKVGDSWVVA